MSINKYIIGKYNIKIIFKPCSIIGCQLELNI